jgi:DNA-directed RNA polymerase specialized sigma24 family protein
MLCDICVNDESVWRKHSAELVRYATVLVGPDHAEDVLSAVVLRTLRAKGSLVSLDDPRPYLFRPVRSATCTTWRSGLTMRVPTPSRPTQCSTTQPDSRAMVPPGNAARPLVRSQAKHPSMDNDARRDCEPALINCYPTRTSRSPTRRGLPSYHHIQCYSWTSVGIIEFALPDRCCSPIC